MSKLKQFYVYALYVSDEPLPFYIGKSYVGSSRFKQHLNPRLHKKENKTPKSLKILSAIYSGKHIIEDRIQIFDNEVDAFECEINTIHKFGLAHDGGCLLNKNISSNTSINKSIGTRTIRRQPKKIANVSSKAKKISAYTGDGVYLKTFGSISTAAKYLDINHRCISACINMVQGQTACKSKQYGIVQFKIGDCSENVAPTNIRLPNLKGNVFQFTLDGIFIEKYDSINDAARKTKIGSTGIAKCCKRKQPHSGGYLWSFDQNNDKEF